MLSNHPDFQTQKNKQIAVHLQSGILLWNKKEWTIDMNESQDKHVE